MNLDNINQVWAILNANVHIQGNEYEFAPKRILGLEDAAEEIAQRLDAKDAEIRKLKEQIESISSPLWAAAQQDFSGKAWGIKPYSRNKTC